MTLLHNSNGILYLPDGLSLNEPPLQRPWPTWIRIVIFVICYVTLQALYAQCGGTAVEKFFLENVGSRPAAALLDMLQPTLDVRAVGTRVAAPGGGINIGNGCEGTDLYFLLIAAFAAVSLSLRLRGIGLGLGLILAFMLNQARIITLFHVYRSDRALFDLFHTTLAPVLLVVALALYFHAWLHYSQRPATAAS